MLLFKGGAAFKFNLQITLWLWFTVLFANFAEAMAEGRGKAQADTLRKARSETMANRLTGSNGHVEQVKSSTLRTGDLVFVSAGESVPSDGEIIEGVASVDESAITGESAPVIREAGGDRSAVTVTKLLASTGAVVGTSGVGAQPIGIAFDGTNIWVANYNGNSVIKLLASTGAFVGTYSVGNNPVGVAFDGTNIWVANQSSNSVTKMLASTGAVVETYGGVGSSPIGVAFDGTNIWVVNDGDNTVTKLLAGTGAVLGTYAVGSAPRGVAFDGTNIWVANEFSNSVSKIGATR